MPRSLELEDDDSEPEAEPSGKAILDITMIPFEPITTGSGHKIEEKQGRLRKAIEERIGPDNLARLRKEAANRLVTVTVIFYLWKGSTTVTNTRPVKDLDNLLKVLFDVLRLGRQGLGLVTEDSYISEVYAVKQLVDDEKQEGYRIIIEGYEDEEMLDMLNRFYSPEPK